jgi:predicted small lipoprotein YifL
MKHVLSMSAVLLTTLSLAACSRSGDEVSAETRGTTQAAQEQQATAPMGHEGDGHQAMGHMAMHEEHRCSGAPGDCSGSSGATPSAATPRSGTIPVTVGDEGFQPSHITLKRGEKSTLRFTRTSDKTCATEVAFPELGIRKPLPLNQPVDIEVPVDQARTLTFQCGMGMYKSQVVISG